MSGALLLTLLASVPHPDSISSSRIVVRGDEAQLRVHCQVLSLLEVIDGLDGNGDDAVSALEVEAKRDEIFAYIGEHYRLFVDSDRDLEGGRRLVAEAESLRHLPPGAGDGIGFRAGSVEAGFVFRSDAPITDLLLDVTLFHVTSPGHYDIATIHWPDDNTDHMTLTRSTPRGRVDPTGRGAFGVFVRLGFEHILSGWDHMAFLLALLFSARNLRSLLWIVTAFTAAHSVTLALAATKVVDTSGHSGLVELVIALSIAYVAADNLMHPKLKRSRWAEAFVFGLVHGLGFAGFLGESLLNEPAKTTALVSFNVGVELGQVLIVLALVALLRFWPRRSEEASFLAPRVVRVLGSAAVVLLGLYWFVERIP